VIKNLEASYFAEVSVWVAILGTENIFQKFSTCAIAFLYTYLYYMFFKHETHERYEKHENDIY